MEKIIALAPMAGVTDWPFRLLCFEQGCDYATTEMVSAMGMVYAPKEHKAYQDLVAVSPDEGRLSVQVFGHEVKEIRRAVKILSDLGQYEAVDINMGCPARKVTSGGSGSALMKTPVLAGQIMRAVKESTMLPVTVKIRLGWDAESINACEMAHIAEDNGVSMLVVHGRTKEQQYSGKADWNEIAKVKQAVSIPVLANGDIVSAETALCALKVTGCDGIAIGRGALGNPWVFSQIKQALRGEEVTYPTFDEIARLAVRHAEMMRSWKTEERAVLEMRKHFSWYIHGRRGAAQMRTLINTTKTLDAVEEMILRFAEEGEQTDEDTVCNNG